MAMHEAHMLRSDVAPELCRAWARSGMCRTRPGGDASGVATTTRAAREQRDAASASASMQAKGKWMHEHCATSCAVEALTMPPAEELCFASHMLRPWRLSADRLVQAYHRGTVRAASMRVVVLGLVKNSGGTGGVLRMLNTVEHTLRRFQDYRVVLFENDSNDGTAKPRDHHF